MMPERTTSSAALRKSQLTFFTNLIIISYAILNCVITNSTEAFTFPHMFLSYVKVKEPETERFHENTFCNLFNNSGGY